MPLEFKPVELPDQMIFRTFLDQCPQVTSDYTFVNIWSWAPAYNISWARAGELIWLQQNRPLPIYWAPVGNWEAVDWPLYFDRYPQFKSAMIRVPEQLARQWEMVFGDKVAILPDRDQFDYIYDAKELAALKGNRFHKKRNLVSQFRKNYEFRYVRMAPEFVEAAMALQDNWCTWRECDSDIQLANENMAIGRVLSHWDRLNHIIGGCLLVGEKMVAYAIGERVPEDVLVVHFEKGNTAYKGVYQAMNQMFVEHETSDPDAGIRWVNREQDLGDAGLRRAKETYHPVAFLKKYRVDFKYGT